MIFVAEPLRGPPVALHHRLVLGQILRVIGTWRRALIDRRGSFNHHDVTTLAVAVEMERHPGVVDDVASSGGVEAVHEDVVLAPKEPDR